MQLQAASVAMVISGNDARCSFFFLFFHFGGATVKPCCEIDLPFGGMKPSAPRLNYLQPLINPANVYLP